MLQYRNDSKELLQWILTHADALELEVQGQMRENPWTVIYETEHTVELLNAVVWITVNYSPWSACGRGIRMGISKN